jgi:ubiquinone/menaquinone biosynthesis C-methylase UbiE
MIPQDHLIAWKTNAWKDPGMVEHYARNTTSNDGGNIVKNEIETAIIAENVRGETVLDVGIGTGRASIPLAVGGYKVTGVDSSQAMLDMTRRKAGETPMTLQLGDVSHLPFEDEQFDNVIGLNTAAHFPHWRDIVQEWSRVLRPGGRLIWDTYSLDHDRAFAAATNQDPDRARELFAAARAEEFMLRLSVEEIIPAFDELGLTVVTIVPYGLMFGSSAKARFLDGSRASGYAWDRMLSYVAADPAFHEFCLFVEREIVAKLTTTVTHRYMVVAERRADHEANAAWLARNRDFEAALRANSGPSSLKPFGLDAQTIRARAGALLESDISRMALVRLLDCMEGWGYKVDLASYIPEKPYEDVRDCLDRFALDDAVSRKLGTWYESADVKGTLEYRGVPLGPTLAYDMMRRFLEEGFDAFADSGEKK